MNAYGDGPSRKSPRCRVCGSALDEPSLNLGRLPVCNRFTTTGGIALEVELKVVECETCSLIQLDEAPPIDALVPRLSWIRYREPESHLDGLVGELLALRPH